MPFFNKNIVNRVSVFFISLTAIFLTTLISFLIAIPSSAWADDAEYVDGEIVITYEGTTESLSLQEIGLIDAALDNVGIDVTETITNSDITDTTVCIADIDENLSVDEAVEIAKSVSGVVDAQPNYVYQIVGDVETGDIVYEDNSFEVCTGEDSVVNDPFVVPTDNYYGFQYYLYGNEEFSGFSAVGSNLFDVWNRDLASNHNQTIAVLDTGVDLNHNDLAGNLLSDLAWDSDKDCALVSTDDFCGDNNGHGTHVAGICGSVTNNNYGCAGVSYNADILPIKVFDDEASNPKASTASLLRAYQYIFNLINSGKLKNLHVVNMSLGMYHDDPALEAILDTAYYDFDILNVCAGGNGDNSSPYTENFYPSDYDSCFSVTALTHEQTNSSWSDYNSSKDISAPGELIYSTYISPHPLLTAFITKSGTSMSAPIVSGVAALLWSIDSSAQVDEIRDVICSTAIPVNNDSYDRAELSGSSGAIDAAAAVDLMLSNRIYARISLPDGVNNLVPRQHVQLNVDVFNDPFVDGIYGIDWDWSIVSGEDIVSVDDTGMVVGLSAGSAVVQAVGTLHSSVAGIDGTTLTAQCRINVVSAKSDSLSVVKSMISVSGPDRYATFSGVTDSVMQFYTNTGGVIVCSAENNAWPDALCAAGLCGVLNYPLILINGNLDYLDNSAVYSLNRYLSDTSSRGNIVIVGGENSVSKEILRALCDYDSDYSPERIAGADRYETSKAIYDYEYEFASGDIGSIVVASGGNFADALSIGSYCVSEGVPLVLSNPICSDTSNDIACKIADAHDDCDFLIVGGKNSVNSLVGNRLEETSGSFKRLAGDDRYATNLKIADFVCGDYSENGLACNFGVATGENFPDALGSSFLLGITPNCSPLFLVSGDELQNQNVVNYISEHNQVFQTAFIFGGTNSVSDSVRADISSAFYGYL